jgi:hypothetical protein
MGKRHHDYRVKRFDDLAHVPPNDAASFFFDLKLILPAGTTGHDVQRARQKIEHRLQRTLRKKDRVVWTADGFFLSMGTVHPARAAAAAERVHKDICKLLGRDTVAVRPDEPKQQPHTRKFAPLDHHLVGR